MQNQFLISLQTIPLLLMVAVLGLAVAYGAVRVFDKCLWTKIDFDDEVKAGNIAVAIVVASLIFGILNLIAQAIA